MNQKPIYQLPLNIAGSDPLLSANGGVSGGFSRGSVGLSADQRGNLVQVGANSPRWVMGANGKYYLALEPAATNLIADISNDFAKWAPDANVSVFAQTQISPNGTYDASEISLPATALVGIKYNSATPSISKTITFSVWLKASAGTPPAILHLVDSVTGSGVNNQIVLSTSWKRYSVTYTFAGTDSGVVSVSIWNNATATATFHAFGAQVEQGVVPTSYITTTPVFITNNNLISDSNMELDGTTSWVPIDGNVTVSKDSVTVLFGRQALKLVTIASLSGVKQDIATVVGATYVFSAWINAAVNSYIQAGSLASIMVAGSVWTKVDLTFKATAVTTTISFYNAVAGTSYIDRAECYRQLCPEPSFEAAGTPPAPWVANGAEAVTAEATIVHSGAKAARIASTAAGGGINVGQSALGLSINTWYRFQAWIYIVSQSSGVVVPKFLAAGSISAGFQLCRSVVGSWQRLSILFKTSGAMAGADAIGISQDGVGTSVFLVDDVSIVALDLPTNNRSTEISSIPLTNQEPSNMLAYSDQFAGASWTKVDTITVADNSVIAPDGSLTASKIDYIGSGSVMLQTIFSMKPLTAYCFSLWVKSDKPTTIEIQLYDASGLALVSVYVSTQWRRVFVTYTTSAAPPYMSAYIQPGGSGINIQKPVTVYLWGAQLEEGSYPSRYARVVGTAYKSKVFSKIASQNLVKRQGSISFWSVVPWASATGSFGNIIGTGGTPDLFITDGGAGNENWNLSRRGFDKTGALVVKTLAMIGTSALSPTAEHFIVVSWGANRDSFGKLINTFLSVSVDGVVVASANYTDIQEWTFIGSNFYLSDGSNNVLLRDLKIWSIPLSDGDVSELYTGAYV